MLPEAEAVNDELGLNVAVELILLPAVAELLGVSENEGVTVAVCVRLVVTVKLGDPEAVFEVVLLTDAVPVMLSEGLTEEVGVNDAVEVTVGVTVTDRVGVPVADGATLALMLPLKLTVVVGVIEPVGVTETVAVLVPVRVNVALPLGVLLPGIVVVAVTEGVPLAAAEGVRDNVDPADAVTLIEGAALEDPLAVPVADEEIVALMDPSGERLNAAECVGVIETVADGVSVALVVKLGVIVVPLEGFTTFMRYVVLQMGSAPSGLEQISMLTTLEPVTLKAPPSAKSVPASN